MVTDINNKKIECILKEIKSKDGQNNLYDHLIKMYMAKKEINDDNKYSDLFEDISIRIKENGTYYPKLKDLNSNEEEEIIKKKMEELHPKISNKIKELLNPLKKVEGEGAEPTPVASVNYVPDYIDLFNKLSYCGISFGIKETYLLNNSLRNLSSTLGAGTVQFFGKIYGTEKDYYIAEASEIDPPAEFNYDADMEKRKEDGFNRNVYFVTNDLTEKWVELPDVKPKQIILSRKIKYIFSGNLNKKIYSNPDFNGEERHLLRCMIGRIYHGTKLVPSINHYTVEDQENPFKQLTPAEKPKKLTIEYLTDLKYWIHYPPGVLGCGRVSHIIDEPPEGVDPDEYKKKCIAKDPFDKRLEPVENDKKIKTGFKGSNDCSYIVPWRIEKNYEDNVYINPYIKLLDETQPDFDPLEQKDNKVNYCCIVVKSLRWPGAINVYTNKENYFFYFGNGMKIEDNNLSTTEISSEYSYKCFPVIPEEKQDKQDQPEPHEKTIPGQAPQQNDADKK